jgi:hypothetical protein
MIIPKPFISPFDCINRYIIEDIMKTVEGAIRLTGFDKPTVWTIMTPLAIKTESANLVLTALCRVKVFHLGNLPSST